MINLPSHPSTDRVPPFSTSTAVSIIESQLGKKIGEVFDSFDDQPIAAASLGQVHRATLCGELVVVKVQRPGLRQLFDIDLKNLRVIAQWLQAVDPKTDGAARDWVAIYDECARILYEEIDYRMEAKNCEEFRLNFVGTEWIRIPEVRWGQTREKVLVMEYVPGVKINNTEAIDKMGLDRKRLARRESQNSFRIVRFVISSTADFVSRAIYSNYCGSGCFTVRTGSA